MLVAKNDSFYLCDWGIWAPDPSGKRLDEASKLPRGRFYRPKWEETLYDIGGSDENKFLIAGSGERYHFRYILDSDEIFDNLVSQLQSIDPEKVYYVLFEVHQSFGHSSDNVLIELEIENGKVEKSYRVLDFSSTGCLDNTIYREITIESVLGLLKWYKNWVSVDSDIGGTWCSSFMIQKVV